MIADKASTGMQDPRAFRQEMSDMFGSLDLDTISEYTSQIINDMMDQIRKHQVHLLHSSVPTSGNIAAC